MLVRLVKNTIFSGSTFLLVGLLSLLVVPIIIKAYGITAFGLIVLARVLLPTGFTAVFDFGISENATQIVARARAKGKWTDASQQVTLLLAIAMAVGFAVGFTLIIFRTEIAMLFNAGPYYSASFEWIVYATGLVVVLMFPGLLAEGIIKGFEQYPVLRLLELLAAGSYVVSALWVIHAGYPYQFIAYAFLASALFKYFAIGVLIFIQRRGYPLRLLSCRKKNRDEVWKRSALMFQGKIMAAVQGQSPPLFVGALVGPAGAGIYDVLVRLPRFAKVVLALLNSALLPVSAQLDEQRDLDRIRRIGLAGFVLLPIFIFPVVIAGAIFSEALLRVWLGPEFADLAPWLALMFAIPMLSVLVNFGQTLILVRVGSLRKMNRLLFMQVCIQLAISIGFVGLFEERSFVFGQVLATVLAFPAQMRLVMQEQGLRPALLLPVFGKHAVIAIFLAGLAWFVGVNDMVHSFPTLAVGIALWCIVYAALAYQLVLSVEERARVRDLAGATFGR